LPIAGGPDIAVNNGESVFIYMPDNIEVGGLAAVLADKIFKGAVPAQFPLSRPNPRLRMNYKLIKKLGLDTKTGLLNRATK